MDEQENLPSAIIEFLCHVRLSEGLAEEADEIIQTCNELASDSTSLLELHDELDRELNKCVLEEMEAENRLTDCSKKLHRLNLTEHRLKKFVESVLRSDRE